MDGFTPNDPHGRGRSDQPPGRGSTPRSCGPAGSTDASSSTCPEWRRAPRHPPRPHASQGYLGPDASRWATSRACHPRLQRGADLANLCNEAALRGRCKTRRGRRRERRLRRRDGQGAPGRPARDAARSRRAPPRRHARGGARHHRALHAERREPLRRVLRSCSRGMSLGATQQWAAADRHIVTEPELSAKLRVLMGGYKRPRTVTRQRVRAARSRTCGKASRLRLR